MPLTWFRMYSDLLADRKLPRIARELGIEKYALIGIWTCLLCMANDSPVRGKLLVTFQKRYSIADVADEVGFDVTFAEKLINVMIEYDMIHLEDKIICISNWEKRQFSSDDSTERVRKFRQKQNSNGVGNSIETLQKRSSNAPDTDTETDTESDTETDKNNNSGVGVVFSLYEQNVGALTTAISDKLNVMLDDYPVEWIVEAIEIAVQGEKRNLRYIEGILKNWKQTGKSDTKKAKTKEKTDYSGGEYAHLLDNG